MADLSGINSDYVSFATTNLWDMRLFYLEIQQ